MNPSKAQQETKCNFLAMRRAADTTFLVYINNLIFYSKKLTKNVKCKEILDFLRNFDIMNPSKAQQETKCNFLAMRRAADTTFVTVL